MSCEQVIIEAGKWTDEVLLHYSVISYFEIFCNKLL